MQGLPNLLFDIVEFLQKQDLNLGKNIRDGQINFNFLAKASIFIKTLKRLQTFTFQKVF